MHVIPPLITDCGQKTMPQIKAACIAEFHIGI